MTAWEKSGSILAFPYKWQEPAATEKWVYEYLIKNNINSKFVEFVCFPWATMIDLISREIWDEANFLLDALRSMPPRKALIRATACQHINLISVIDQIKNSKITDIYWSHKTLDVASISGVRVHPLPLYPLSYHRFSVRKNIPLSQRKYLFSFIGAYDENSYLTKTRGHIFNFSNSPNLLLIKRSAWHLEGLVYEKQILGRELNEVEINCELKNAKEYADAMQNTIYSLCPSGTGPNTIRYWESLAYGCIPIILSDTWDKSPIPSSWIDIRYPENQVSSLHDYLNKIELDSFGVAPNTQSESQDFSSDWLRFIPDQLENSENILNWTKRL
jgi:hypothetical protein